MSKRSLSNRLDDLESEYGLSGAQEPREFMITDHVVTERGGEPEPFKRVRVWCDGRGDWHREVEYDQPPESIKKLREEYSDDLETRA